MFIQANTPRAPFRLAQKALIIFLCLLGQAHAQSVDYTVSFDEVQNHRLQVTAVIPPSAFPTERRELALPVWTPGSYKVRDYSRFLSEITPLNEGARVSKTSKNRWLIEGVPSDQPVRVTYSVYGHELTVRTNYFTPDLSLVIGAATFVAPAPLQSEQMATLPYRVTFDTALPVYSGLPQEGKTFEAADYVELLDCPFLTGDVTSHPFTAGDKPHELIQAGDRRYWDLSKSLKDTQTLVSTIQEFWGGVIPYDRYLFMNLITDARGGLEHRNSTVVMAKRFATEDRKGYLGWLSIMSHEYFHTWNVKQLRPAALRPFDFENENYTRSLWIAEGITSYYDDLLVRRAGLSTRKEYLEALSGQLNQLWNTPGRRNITLSDASFDAWIRLYQPTDDLHNSNISYYNKGAVVAWLLDTEIRQKTNGSKSLDDVMRAAYSAFSDSGFEELQFRALAAEVSGLDLSEFFQRTIDSTEELDLAPALAYWNLTWKAKEEKPEPYLGVDLQPGPRAVVSKVYEGSPAALAGLAPGDEILAIDEVRLPETSPLSLLKHLKGENTRYEVLLSRLGRIITKDIVLAKPSHEESKLSFGKSDRASEKRWKQWLGNENEAESKS